MSVYRKKNGAWYVFDNSTGGTKIISNDPYLNLAGAILKKAVDEYIEALVYNNINSIRKLEKFFLSEWGQKLSFQQGEYIVEKARTQANDKKLRIHDMKMRYMERSKRDKTKH